METFPHIARALSISKEAGGFTEYEVTQDEIEQGCNGRNDNIARIMGHPYRGQSADGWLLPYPSLIPRGLSGLLVTGKPACRFIHYQVTCAAIGQAAGIAAAVAAQDITPLRQLDVSRIQNLLKQQGLGYK
jgi:hypothetical protein